LARTARGAASLPQPAPDPNAWFRDSLFGALAPHERRAVGGRKWKGGCDAPVLVVSAAAREPVVMQAARLEGRHRLSYADAFAVALAQSERAPVLTGDPEILALPRAVAAVRALDRG
jgi:hypothetical protein